MTGERRDVQGMERTAYVRTLRLRPEARTRRAPRSARLSAALLALVMAACAVAGEAFENLGDTAPLVASRGAMALTLFKLGAWTAQFYLVLRIAFALLDRWCDASDDARQGRLGAFALRHGFALPFVVLLVGWLPVLCTYAPGLCMGDTFTQILSWFDLPNHVTRHLMLVNPEQLLNDHHPLVHTALLGLCVQAGQTLAHSCSVGMLAYTCLQYLCFVLCIAYAISTVARITGSARVVGALTLLMLVNPVMSDYAVLVAKDTPFASALLLFVCAFARRAYLQDATRRSALLLVVGCLGMMAFKHGSLLYVLGGAVTLVALGRRNLRVALACVLLSVAAQLCVTNVVIPAFDITPGSPREVLSIPFQQTARYVCTYPDEVTDEERAAIAAVLDYEHLADNYSGSVADHVKETFNPKATREDIHAYLQAWARMGRRHPWVYAKATMHNYYGYVYVSEGTAQGYRLSKSVKNMSYAVEAGLDVHPLIAPGEDGSLPVERLQRWAFDTAPFSLVGKSALYTWLMVVLLVEAARHRRQALLLALVPVVLCWLICFIGPMNGSVYLRYIFPVALVLPFLYALLPCPCPAPRGEI